mmetsp:Transcript_15597/g.24253  ORF Transcript_15597/g.24253 Transcript_15597/m.24253 type:complete len:100 (-) Transcript_15597:153-452(-)|eukprot:CAMPEP_0184315334 /NCGR_PEP_ID=MMETSP1049-20130417/81587_1 /TAXON_ID=77928 /ORGANISM="Proteomonas sulcata, Strain CCMP704" /LENGTH=99 /DNA_ID=CAMNT_0026633753 /DNA_START=276 /DNA_END=575 /DNA_ORIENTATION=-
MPVRHIVLLKFKEGTQEEASRAKQNIEALQGKITGLVAVSFGPSFTTDRAKGYTHCLVVDVADRDALKVYLEHPDHVAVAQNDFKPFLQEPSLAVDYEF